MERVAYCACQPFFKRKEIGIHMLVELVFFSSFLIPRVFVWLEGDEGIVMGER